MPEGQKILQLHCKVLSYVGCFADGNVQDGYDSITVSEKTLNTSEITGSFIVIVRACLMKVTNTLLNSKEHALVLTLSSAWFHNVYLGL